MKGNSILITFWVATAVIAAAIEPIIVKLGYAGSATPIQLLVMKSLIGALIILPLTRTWRWIGWSGLRKVSLVSLLLLTTNGLILLALQQLSAVTVITIITTTPAFVALLNQKLGRDVLGTKFWIGFAMCFAGILLDLNLQELSFTWIGLAEVFGAVLSSTIYRVQLESTTKELPPALVSTYIFLINGFIIAAFVAPWSSTATPAVWGLGIWMGLAAAAANVAFLYALSLLGSSRISIILLLERPVVIIAALLILKENMSWQKIAGICLIMLGVQMARVIRKATASAVPPSIGEKPLKAIQRI